MEFQDGQVQFTSRNLIPQGTWHKIFLCLTIAAGILILILNAASIQSASASSDQYFAIIVIISCIWAMYFAFHGIYKHNRYEIYSLLFVFTLISISIIYRFADRSASKELDALQYIVLIVMGAFVISFAVVSVKLILNWEQWRFDVLVPALQNDLHLLNLYRWYEIWISLLKLDILLSVIFILMSVLFLFSTLETFINMAAIFVVFIWAGIGHIAVRLEDKKMTILFYLLSPIIPANIIYKLVEFNNGSDQYIGVPVPQIIFVGIVALLIRSILMFSTFKMASNYGKNLRDKVFDPEEEQEPVLNVITETQVKPYLTLTINRVKSAINLQRFVHQEQQQNQHHEVELDSSLQNEARISVTQPNDPIPYSPAKVRKSLAEATWEPSAPPDQEDNSNFDRKSKSSSSSHDDNDVQHNN